MSKDTLNNFFFLFPNAYGEGEESKKEEASDNSSASIDENHPDVQRIIAGLKKKNQDLIAQEKKLKERINSFEDVDPNEAREAIKEHRASKDRKLIDEGKIEELLNARTERMRQDQEAQLKAKDKILKEYEAQVGKLTSDLHNAVLGSAINYAATMAGIRPQATQLVEKMALDVWKVEENKPRAYDHSGPIMGKDTKPITMKEWVESLRQEHAYLFKESHGGDAGGMGGSGKAGVRGGEHVKRSEMNATQASAYIAEHGLDAWRKLPA